MKLGRTLVVSFLSAVGLVVTAQGCQDPTQVTLELSLDKKAACAEIAAGTAITVGIEPFDTESRVATGFVTARTTDCNATTNEIGTLVVTPSDSGKASVIVVVGYKDNDPTSCKPPLYEGCIVARRRFAFAEHTRLRMPIRIDPDCAGVPCDAFSTCNKGRCYDSETLCSGTACENPGELSDGGIDEAGQVEPDASGFDSGPIEDDGGTKDAGPDDLDAGGDAYCTATNTLFCNGISCGSGLLCCGESVSACSSSCAQPTKQLCCVDGAQDGCPQGYTCVRPKTAPGRCQLAVNTKDASVAVALPYCTATDNKLNCNADGVACSGPTNACCATNGVPACLIGMGTCNGGSTRYCCSSADCSTADGGMAVCKNNTPPGIPGEPRPAGTCQ